MELKLLWMGVALEDRTALASESHDAALQHALSDCPDGGPIMQRWLCAVENGKAIPICLAPDDGLPIGVVVKAPGL
jgi:hypothetical protein